MKAPLENLPSSDWEPSCEPFWEPMTETWLDRVCAIEQQAYAHPWSRGNFSDSLQAGYQAQLLLAGCDLLGYYVAMPSVDEVHLLNLTVVPAHQGRGWGRLMLNALADWARQQQMRSLWLEVRRSNEGAQRLYGQQGFHHVGVRSAYYPAGAGLREDALVMSLTL